MPMRATSKPAGPSKNAFPMLPPVKKNQLKTKTTQKAKPQCRMSRRRHSIIPQTALKTSK
jgi:hypothetical protein